MDLIGSVDPYVLIQMSNSKHIYKTKTIKNTYNPRWNQEFSFPVTNPQNDYITFFLKDSDTVKTDDPISKLKIQLCTLQINKVNDQWYSPTPVMKIKKGGQLHLVIQLAQQGVVPFREAPPPGQAFGAFGMAANNFMMFGQGVMQMATNPQFQANSLASNPMAGAIPHPMYQQQPMMAPGMMPQPMMGQPQPGMMMPQANMMPPPGVLPPQQGYMMQPQPGMMMQPQPMPMQQPGMMMQPQPAMMMQPMQMPIQQPQPMHAQQAQPQYGLSQPIFPPPGM